jgi:uncharacterized protein
MKVLTLILFLSVALTPVYARQNPIAAQRTTQFIGYFNRGSNDSLYTLFSPELKSKLPPATLTAAEEQLKHSLGNLVSGEYFNSQSATTTYLATFEKSGPVLYIHFDVNNDIVGFFVNADQRTSAAPDADGVTINTDSAVIKGTLLVPAVSTPVPVVLLIAGSGPTDRNGNSALLGGKPNYFLQIADSLKGKEIATLRYDKRGIGQSTTSRSMTTVTIDDMVNDAVAIIKMLKADKRFSKVIVAGHSEGSLVGMLALTHVKADGFISLDGAGEPADKILATQLKPGLSPADYNKLQLIMDSVKAGHYPQQPLGSTFSMLFGPAVQTYVHSWMQYDPAQIISKLTMPVLIIQGSHDFQVSEEDAARLKKGNPKAQLVIISGMSHILKEGPADKQANFATYSAPDLPLHPQLIPALVKFINK